MIMSPLEGFIYLVGIIHIVAYSIFCLFWVVSQVCIRTINRAKFFKWFGAYLKAKKDTSHEQE